MQDRPKGLLIILFGVLIISPDAVLVRYLSEGGAEPWTIIFWKMLFAIPITAVFAVWEAGSFSQLWSSMVYSKKYYLIAIPLQCVVDIFFTLSFVYTSAALALLLININPLWCAVAGRILLGDQLKKKTYLALVLAFGCMLIIFIPELLPTNTTTTLSTNTTTATATTTTSDNTVLLEPEHLFESSMKGNIIALCTGLGLAAYITVVRHGSLKGGGPTSQGPPHAPPQKINLVGAAAISATVTMLLSVLVRKGDVVPSTFWTGTTLWSFWIAQIAEGCAIGIIFIVMTIAPRYITGAEVGLCVLLEAVLGPFFVYLAYGDVPSTYTLIGGGLLLTVLAVHESRPLFEKANTVRRSISRRFSQPRNSRSSSSSRSAMMIAKQHQQLEEEEEEEERMNDGNPLKDENSDDPVEGVGASVHDTIDKEEECC